MQWMTKIFVLGLLLAAWTSPAKDRFVPDSGANGEGKSIYLRNCSKCHKFYPPSNYSQPEWDKWMVKMRRKSKLKSADFDKVLQYIQTLRDGHSAPTGKKR
jgi:mono/diheme cytochrome c family protein